MLSRLLSCKCVSLDNPCEIFTWWKYLIFYLNEIFLSIDALNIVFAIFIYILIFYFEFQNSFTYISLIDDKDNRILIVMLTSSQIKIILYCPFRCNSFLLQKNWWKSKLRTAVFDFGKILSIKNRSKYFLFTQ